MPACFPVLAPVRKEVRGIRVRAPAHIIDRVVPDTSVSELKSYEGDKVTVRLGAIAANDGVTTGCPLHFSGDFFSDLELPYADVRTDRHHELGRVVRKRLDRLRNDASNGASPTRMHRTHVSARWMRN